MIYYQNEHLTVRDMRMDDALSLFEAEKALGYGDSENRFPGRVQDAAEKVAFGRSDRVWLAVGLHHWYGPAQRMYARRGFIPDGSGVWYGNRVAEAYATVMNDDDLNLYLVKELRGVC